MVTKLIKIYKTSQYFALTSSFHEIAVLFPIEPNPSFRAYQIATRYQMFSESKMELVCCDMEVLRF